jgi:DNA helicase II / ATP-dependent DNA helicase PcrA
MSKNKLVIAAAGSGKTRMLVENALAITTGKVLITTYTQANEAEIRNRIVEKAKCIPNHITVQTWVSFLMQHGVRPFQGYLFDKKIRGFFQINGRSGLMVSEKYQFEKFYFTKDHKIYSDKLAKFVIRCDEKSGGQVLKRLSSIYSHLYIDEFQDLSGEDLDLLSLFFRSRSEILLVGDPRQGVLSTNVAAKNKQFRKSKIVGYFDNPKIDLDIDDTSLQINYRCIEAICNLSNQLFPELNGATSGNMDRTGHDGIFFVKEGDVQPYLERYTPMQLRDSKRKKVHDQFRVMNFGIAKGLAFERILIYPTKPILDWLLNHSSELAPESRSNLYVALTRARFSIGVVCPDNHSTLPEGFQFFEPGE